MTPRSDKPGPMWGGPNPRGGGRRQPPSALRRALVAVVAKAGLALAALCWLTYRLRIEADDSELATLTREDGPVVFILWHRWGTLGCYYIQRRWSRRLRPAYLVSPSRDGDFAARALAGLGARVVRGSATRTSIRSLRELYRVMTREHASPVILPDGPTGPVHTFKPGALILAQTASRPMLLMGFEASRVWHLPTWDRHAIPRPFARLYIRLAIAPAPPRDLDSAGLERETERLGLWLDSLHQARDRKVESAVQ